MGTFRNFLTNLRGQIGPAIGAAMSNAAATAGNLLGQAAFLPLKVSLDAFLGEFKKVLIGFNPGVVMMKSFNEYNKAQEKFAAANLDVKLATQNLKNIGGGLKGSLTEALSNSFDLFQAGLDPTNSELLKLTERMRVTGQKSDTMIKSMSVLAYSNSNNKEVIDRSIRSVEELRKTYGVSQEVLYQAMSKLDQDTEDISTLMGENAQVKQFQATLASVSKQMSDRDKNLITSLLYGTKDAQMELRRIAGIDSERIKAIESIEDEKERGKAVIELAKEATKQFQQLYDTKGEPEIARKTLEELGIAPQAAAMKRLADLDLNKVISDAKTFQPTTGAEQAYTTMNAQLEAFAKTIDSKILPSMDQFRSGVIRTAKDLNYLSDPIMKHLFDQIVNFAPYPQSQNAPTQQPQTTGAATSQQPQTTGPATSQQAAQQAAQQVTQQSSNQKNMQMVLEQFVRDTYDKQDTWWDTTTSQIRAFGEAMGTVENNLAYALESKDISNMQLPLDSLINKALEQRGSGWLGYYPFAQEAIPSQMFEEFKINITEFVQELRDEAQNIQDQNKKEQYIKESLKILEDANLVDYMNVRDRVGGYRVIEQLSFEDRTIAQEESIKTRNKILEDEFRNLIEKFNRAVNDRNEQNVIVEKLESLKTTIEAQETLNRSIGYTTAALTVPSLGT